MHRKNIQLFFFFFMRYRVSPLILEDVYKHGFDDEEMGRLFALGTSSLKIGKIFKTTGLMRTRMADGMLLKRAEEKKKPSLMEIGVSDGSSSLGLFDHFEMFERIVLTDRFSRFYVRKHFFWKLILDAEKRMYGLKILCFFIFLSPKKVKDSTECVPIEVINPILRKKYGIQAITRFDMFEDVLDEPVDLIKCSNILNKAYFSDREICLAVAKLCQSLREGGHILISQNNKQYKDGEAGFILRKEGDDVYLEEAFNNHDCLNLFKTYIG